MSTKLKYGLIGCGGFGRFCLQQYGRMPNVECIAVADNREELALAVAREFKLEACASPEALLERTDIDLVHLATPPFTHASLAIAALEAGKHVLCEKPLALTEADASDMISLAHDKGLILAVNLIMRYNPLCLMVKNLVGSKLLGLPLHASLMNAAQDETLFPDHWFWDPTKSGGIFIEHGVHFFDLFEWWFGPGKVQAAQQLFRPGTERIEQVQCALRYGDTTLATFYHGFHQMLRRDQQQWRIVFETGTLTMTEWVPTRLLLDATLSEVDLQAICELCPGGEVTIQQHYAPEESHPTSRDQLRTAEIHASILWGAGYEKMDLYGQMLRDLLDDQIAAIRDKSHFRRVSETNGLSSLLTAILAQQAADAALLS